MVGRFPSNYPVGFASGGVDYFNRYAYTANNPVNNIDPDGQFFGKFVRFGRKVIQHRGNVFKAGKETIIETAQAVATIADPNASAFDKASAVFDLASPVDSKEVGSAVKRIKVSRSKSPESARHLEDSGATGRTLTVDRGGRDQRRRDNMRGTQTQSGMDRDESPPAIFRESENASVRSIPSSDNRSSGAQIGNQIRDVADGGCVAIEICD